MLGGEYAEFFDCNNKTNNPQTQDDLGNGVPPGFTWSECIPPKVEVHGDGTKINHDINDFENDEYELISSYGASRRLVKKVSIESSML